MKFKEDKVATLNEGGLSKYGSQVDLGKEEPTLKEYEVLDKLLSHLNSAADYIDMEELLIDLIDAQFEYNNDKFTKAIERFYYKTHNPHYDGIILRGKEFAGLVGESLIRKMHTYYRLLDIKVDKD